jgi:3-methylornithyl-N6-L-lysine dehydrogenase
VTRLTEEDVRSLTADLLAFETGLQEVTGLTLRGLAERVVADDARLRDAQPGVVRFDALPVGAVPVTTGEGVIPGFCECLVVILRHLGCQAEATSLPDVRGLQQAADRGDGVVFIADDRRFIALNIRTGACVDDDPATADGYVTALAAAADGLEGREVLLLGLGPVGRFAGKRLAAMSARLLVTEPDPSRVDLARAEGLDFERADLSAGLARCDLLFDATPAADLVDVRHLRDGLIAAVPGVPSAFTPAAQVALGARHIHEPLAVGVAVMAARALVG